MDLSKYKITDWTDPTWMNDYINSMGENMFWHYRNGIDKELNKLEVGQCIEVTSWCKEENYDIFIKMCCCYLSESRGCYSFNPEFTIIKRNFNAQEMERTLALLRNKRREQEFGINGDGVESRSGRTQVILAQEPTF